jgi:hypothetical protein
VLDTLTFHSVPGLLLCDTPVKLGGRLLAGRGKASDQSGVYAVPGWVVLNQIDAPGAGAHKLF